LIRRFVNRRLLDRWDWGIAIADVYSSVDRFVVRPKWLRSFLHGTWLGHPLHPLLTDVPIGARLARPGGRRDGGLRRPR